MRKHWTWKSKASANRTKICPQCNKEFSIYPSQDWIKCCSTACARVGNQNGFKKGQKVWWDTSNSHPNPIKGKTYNEYYGAERAMEITDKMAKSVSHPKKDKSNYAWSSERKEVWSGINRGSRGTVGTFFSNKNQKTMRYRSTWEEIAMNIFERMNTVSKYEYEALSIPWIDEKGKKHNTIPDFLVHYTNGTKQIVEIKPQYMIEKNLKNTKLKIEAMEVYAREKNIEFSVWTEKEINPKY